MNIRRQVLPRLVDDGFPSRRGAGPTDREAYRERNVVERLINRLTQWRRIATRSDKRGVNHHAMVPIGTILLWL